MSQRRLDEAIAQYTKYADQRPKSAGAQTAIGMLLQMQKKNSEARAKYEHALELDPRAAVAANNLAMMHAENGGNLEVALRLAQTAKAGLPNRAEVSDTLGWIYYKKGLGSMAVAALRDSVQKDPKAPLYHYHLGLAYLQSGKNTDARQALQQALKLDPSFDGAEDAKRALANIKG
jgi:Flp pilus assembly protein TadD